MSTFNHKRLKQQKLLAKEDIDLLLEAIKALHSVEHHYSIERVQFLTNKLERMKK